MDGMYMLTANCITTVNLKKGFLLFTVGDLKNTVAAEGRKKRFCS